MKIAENTVAEVTYVLKGDDGVIIQTDGFAITQRGFGNVTRRYFDIKPTLTLNRHATTIVLPVLANLFITHAVDRCHGRVAKTTTQVDKVNDLVIVFFVLTKL